MNFVRLSIFRYKSLKRQYYFYVLLLFGVNKATNKIFFTFCLTFTWCAASWRTEKPAIHLAKFPKKKINYVLFRYLDCFKNRFPQISLNFADSQSFLCSMCLSTCFGWLLAQQLWWNCMQRLNWECWEFLVWFFSFTFRHVDIRELLLFLIQFE